MKANKRAALFGEPYRSAGWPWNFYRASIRRDRTRWPLMVARRFPDQPALPVPSFMPGPNVYQCRDPRRTRRLLRKEFQR